MLTRRYCVFHVALPHADPEGSTYVKPNAEKLRRRSKGKPPHHSGKQQLIKLAIRFIKQKVIKDYGDAFFSIGCLDVPLDELERTGAIRWLCPGSGVGPALRRNIVVLPSAFITTSCPWPVRGALLMASPQGRSGNIYATHITIKEKHKIMRLVETRQWTNQTEKRPKLPNMDFI
jgi:hypothetical protein